MPNVSILSVLRERAGLTPNDIASTFTGSGEGESDAEPEAAPTD